MPVTNSPEQVCTRVMDVLKEEGVSDIEAPITLIEGLCSRHYEDVKRELLRKHTWSFARKRTTLLGVSASAEGFTYKYLLPNDCVRFLFLGTSYTDSITDFVIEGRYIYSNYGEGSVRLAYIYDVQNVLYFDPLFLSCLVFSLAVICSCALSGIKTSILNNLKALRDESLRDARVINGQENKPKVIDNSYMDRARNRLSGTSDYNRFGY